MGEIKDTIDTAKLLHQSDQLYLDKLSLRNANNINALTITLNSALIVSLFGLFLESKLIMWSGLAGALFQGWLLFRYLSKVKSQGL